MISSRDLKLGKQNGPVERFARPGSESSPNAQHGVQAKDDLSGESHQPHQTKASRQGCFFVWLCHARLEFSAEQPSVLFCTIRMRLFRPENDPWRKTQFKNKEKHMKKFRTTVSVIIMILAGIAGFFAGSAVLDGMGGAILFSMIAGIGCIVYAADNRS